MPSKWTPAIGGFGSRFGWIPTGTPSAAARAKKGSWSGWPNLGLEPVAAELVELPDAAPVDLPIDLEARDAAAGAAHADRAPAEARVEVAPPEVRGLEHVDVGVDDEGGRCGGRRHRLRPRPARRSAPGSGGSAGASRRPPRAR